MLTSRPLSIALLCSRRAPALAHLLRPAAGLGTVYDLKCCLTSEETFDEAALAASHGIPVVARSIRAFYREAGAPLRDLSARAAFDAGSAEILARYAPDLVLTCGYLFVLTRPMLDAFPNRILNLHHADLLQLDAAGLPRYPGLRAVRAAILAGEAETRSTVHLVTSELDAGPPVARSWAYPISPLVADARRLGRVDVLKAYAYAHQEWMIATSWGPLVEATLRLTAGGRVRVGVDGAWIGASPAPIEIEPPDAGAPRRHRPVRPSSRAALPVRRPGPAWRRSSARWRGGEKPSRHEAGRSEQGE